MRMLDLFSGIGGFSLAAQWTWGNELEIVQFVEKDKFCQKVLKKHWPDVPICDDIRKFKGDKYAETIDLITGGFPCQPFSVAGKRKGKEDDRWLWPEMFRVIREVRPRWVIGENVAGIINLGLDEVLSDLESEGYEVQTFIIPACAVGAWHRRDRVWIVANAEGSGRDEKQITDTFVSRIESSREIGRFYCETRSEQWLSEPGINRVANGIPNRVDRLRALGNAIVPQVAHVIMQVIKEIDHASP
ncbi:MAG: DNA (cytosine-5-)-methyltransferase [Calditrichaeota bacterium]|nr:DNA (cytosine-5-)-methyltransferase [Calditrichota bacterium]